MSQSILEIEQDFQSKVDYYFANQISNPISRDRNRASDIGFACDTYQAACRLKGELRQKITVELKRIFRVGEEWEDPNFNLLKKAGVPVRAAAQSFYWRELNISGRLDGVSWISPPSSGKEIEIPAEHKTCSPNMLRVIKKIKKAGGSLVQAKQHWLRKYPAQLMIYMLFKGHEYGLWYFFEKVTGQDLFWIAELDYSYTEECLKRAERCNKNVENNFIPTAVFKDLCLGCDYEFTLCFPDRNYGPGIDLMESEEIEEMLKKFKETEPYHSEHNKLYAELIGSKAKQGLFYGKNAIIGGKYQIRAKETESGFRHSIEVLGEESERVPEIIRDSKGKFTSIKEE